jgi:hypothetical protein
MKSTFVSIARHALLFAILSLLISAACTKHNPRGADPLSKAQGSVLKEPPQTTDANAKYLFYLHGRIIEEKGIRPVDPQYGVYEYEQIENFDIDLYGNVLSIYDVNDEFGHTCQKLFKASTGLNRIREVELKIGTGHAILYKPMKEWVDLVVEWAEGV